MPIGRAADDVLLRKKRRDGRAFAQKSHLRRRQQQPAEARMNGQR